MGFVLLYQKAYHILKALARVSIKVLFSPLCMSSTLLAEVWAAFSVGACFETIGVL